MLNVNSEIASALNIQHSTSNIPRPPGPRGQQYDSADLHDHLTFNIQHSTFLVLLVLAASNTIPPISTMTSHALPSIPNRPPVSHHAPPPRIWNTVRCAT